MIIPISGNVTYPITLDASVWIFDDRKIKFEEAFTDKPKEDKKVDPIKKKAEELTEAYDPKAKQVNPGMNKQEREEALTNSFVMPLKQFVDHTEPKDDATKAKLITNKGEVEISLNELENSLLHFSKEGKPLTEDGPVHLYFKDGSNKDNPITGITKIIIE